MNFRGISLEPCNILEACGIETSASSGIASFTSGAVMKGLFFINLFIFFLVWSRTFLLLHHDLGFFYIPWCWPWHPVNIEHCNFLLSLSNGSSHWGLSWGQWDFCRSPWTPWRLSSNATTNFRLCHIKLIWLHFVTPFTFLLFLFPQVAQVSCQVKGKSCWDIFGVNTLGATLVEITKIFDKKMGFNDHQLWFLVCIWVISQPFLNQNSTLIS